MMPVEKLPVASWATTLGLGFVSAVFDNIPLTALAIKQGGYDWGMLAYAVGFGGSMIWFGSSAGVALSGMYPETKSVFAWLRAGWHVVLAYVIGFAVMLALHDGTPTLRLNARPRCHRRLCRSRGMSAKDSADFSGEIMRIGAVLLTLVNLLPVRRRAMVVNAPLLFKGTDFAATDVTVAQ